MSRDAAEPPSVAGILLVAQVFMSHTRRSFEIDLRRAAAAAISQLARRRTVPDVMSGDPRRSS
ncbi:MAG: hypothetical protein WA418_29885 [Bradyrhizobium sp.]